MKRVAFGGADYVHELGLTVGMDEAELAEAKARVVLSCAPRAWKARSTACGSSSARPTAPARSLERSRRNGFQGRLCVHPDQLAPVNAAYLPSDAELAAPSASSRRSGRRKRPGRRRSRWTAR